MDDYKYALYLEARRLIESGEESCVCFALGAALYGGGTYKSRGTKWTEGVFQEFSDFFEGKSWQRWGTCEPIRDSECSWWSYGWKEPRLRAIDLLLRRQN